MYFDRRTWGIAAVLNAALLCGCAGARPEAPEPRAGGKPDLLEKATPAAEPAQTEPSPAAVAKPQSFGAELDPETPEISLAQLLESPGEHAGKTIRTQGTIERVCQKMGCWMEIRDAGAPNAVRVPMAGHAFFLPQSVEGKRCTLQGTVSVESLSDDHKRHLEAEGAQATDMNVSIVATGVVVAAE